MKLDIPFFSQLDDSVPEEHKRSVCALACIKMIFDSKNIQNTFETIYTEAEIIGGKESSGWNHETIVRLLRNHGVLAYRQEFLGHSIDLESKKGTVALCTDLFTEKGIEKIRGSIDLQNPIMVSVRANFSDNKEDHVVLIVGYEDNNLIILDPILDFQQNPRKISIEELKKFWKNFAIFIE